MQRTALAVAVAIGLVATGCSAVGQPVDQDQKIKQVLAGRAVELIDAGPAGTTVLLPGSASLSRQFAAALALAPYRSAAKYLPQLTEAWSADGLYGPKGNVAEQAEVTRLAALLSRSHDQYRAALFPADRLAALVDRVSKVDDPESKVSLTGTLRLLDGSSTVDCAALSDAVLAGDFSKAADPGAASCEPSAAVVEIARVEAERAAAEVRDWQTPSPGQVLDLGSRLNWTAGYTAAALRPVLEPAAESLSHYLTGYAELSAPFLPNLPADQLRLLFDLVRQVRPQWRPPASHLDQLRRTLDWRGRLPEQVRNDPTTYVYGFALLAGSDRQEVVGALPHLRASVLSDTGDPLDSGLRAIAAGRADRLTDGLVAGAAAAVGDDPRLGARLAAMVSYRGECPPAAAGALSGLLRSVPEELALTQLYYYAVITQALNRCPGSAASTAVHSGLRGAAGKYADRAAQVIASPEWPNWFQLWLFAEASCSLGNAPTLDAPALQRAADTMVNGDGWAKFDPNSGYALSRSLDIARDGCSGAWFNARQ